MIEQTHEPAPKAQTNRSHKLVRSLVFAGALTLVAACGSGSETATSGNSGVATLAESAANADAPINGDGTNASADPEAPTDLDEASDLYTKCMDDAGFAVATGDFADGDEDLGNLDFSDPQGVGGDFDIEAFDKAELECQKHFKNVEDTFEMTPEQEAELRDADAKFEKCMTDAGFTTDFGTDSGLAVDEAFNENQSDPQGDDTIGNEKYNEALDKCGTEAFGGFSDVAVGE